MWHEGAVIFLPGMVENTVCSVEGIYFVVLEWCEIGLLRGVCVNGGRMENFDNYMLNS